MLYLSAIEEHRETALEVWDVFVLKRERKSSILTEQEDIWATVEGHQHTSVRHMPVLIPTGAP